MTEIHLKASLNWVRFLMMSIHPNQIQTDRFHPSHCPHTVHTEQQAYEEITTTVNQKLMKIDQKDKRLCRKIVGEIILGKKIPVWITYYTLNRMNQKRIWYQRKLRIRKQSTSPAKPIILLKLLGTITINYCNIVVHIYSLFCPWLVLTGYKKAIEGFGTQFQQF